MLRNAVQTRVDAPTTRFDHASKVIAKPRGSGFSPDALRATTPPRHPDVRRDSVTSATAKSSPGHIPGMQ